MISRVIPAMIAGSPAPADWFSGWNQFHMPAGFDVRGCSG